MEQLFQEYREIAEFFLVYISEAHAMDDAIPTPSAFKKKIREPRTHEQRCDVAERLVHDKKLTMPCLVDRMGNDVARSYRAWPDRVYLIDRDGRIGVASRKGPIGFRPGLKRLAAWLGAYRESLPPSREPASDE